MGWGLFFIWVGVSTLADLGWGIGLLGVAAVILLMQAVRRYFGRRLEPFWLVVGGAVLLGGIWELYRFEVSLMPVILILVGGALLVSVFGRRRGMSGWCRSRLEGGKLDFPDRTKGSAPRPVRWRGCC